MESANTYSFFRKAYVTFLNAAVVLHRANTHSVRTVQYVPHQHGRPVRSALQLRCVRSCSTAQRELQDLAAPSLTVPHSDGYEGGRDEGLESA